MVEMHKFQLRPDRLPFPPPPTLCSKGQSQKYEKQLFEAPVFPPQRLEQNVAFTEGASIYSLICWIA
jgi:hypothetical protein